MCHMLKEAGSTNGFYLPIMLAVKWVKADVLSDSGNS